MKIIIFLVARLVEFLQCLLVKIMRVSDSSIKGNVTYLLLFWCLSGEMEDEVMLCAAVGCISEVRDIVMRLLAEVEELEDESEADCGCE